MLSLTFLLTNNKGSYNNNNSNNNKPRRRVPCLTMVTTGYHPLMGCGALLLLVLLATSVTVVQAQAQPLLDLANWDVVVSRMEQVVLESAQELEALYATRCSNDVITPCARGNFDGCSSRFPSLQCIPGADLTPPDCGDGVECAALFDLETSMILLYEDTVVDDELQLVEDPKVVEDICFSQRIDAYWAQKQIEDEPFWNSFGVSPPRVFFGSTHWNL